MHSRWIAGLAAGLVIATGALAQEGVERTELNRKPVSGAHRLETVISRVVIRPRGRIALHTHPGDEHAVILAGGPVTTADGRETALPDGAALFFPEGMVHGGITVTGDAPVEILTTHVVRIGEPMTALAE